MNLFATLLLSTSLLLAGAVERDPHPPAAPGVSVKCPCHGAVSVPADQDITTSWDGLLTIVFDAGERPGHERAVVVYYDGEKVSEHSLDDLIDPDEIRRHIPSCRCLKNERIWRGRIGVALRGHLIELTPSWDADSRITIDGETGRVWRERTPIVVPFPCFDA